CYRDWSSDVCSSDLWDFQRRATFWLGLTMCDTESSPNFTRRCTPNSDANAAFRSSDPSSPHYIGRSPGNAFMELQFYGPGWVPRSEARRVGKRGTAA